VLIVLVGATFSSISQIVYEKDTSITCLPNSKLRSAIKKIEICKVMEEELAITKSNVTILETRLATKDAVISEYKNNEVLFGQREDKYKSMLANLNQQISNEKKISIGLNLKLRTAKINKWVFGGSGLLIGICVLILNK